MSRWASPACTDRDDVTIHGSAKARDEVKELEEQERRDEEELDDVITNVPFIAVWVITRSGRKLTPDSEVPSSSGGSPAGT